LFRTKGQYLPGPHFFDEFLTAIAGSIIFAINSAQTCAYYSHIIISQLFYSIYYSGQIQVMASKNGAFGEQRADRIHIVG